MRKIVHSRDEAIQFLKQFARENGVRFSIVDDVRTIEEGYMYDSDKVGRKPVYRWCVTQEEKEEDESFTVWVRVDRL